MMKKFLNGLIFGAGFAVAFVVVATAAFFLVTPRIITDEITYPGGREEVSAAPELKHNPRFLGSTGAYSGDFSHGKSSVLSRGPGKIVGTTNVSGEPLAGLKLRLALNGSVMSQWATTDSSGRYAISVPYGEYRIDGFDIDRATANKVLPGKIDHPGNPYSSGTFAVSDGTPGRGLDFKFVDPVELALPRKRFSVDEEIAIRWKPYPGAIGYTVQIYEKPDPHSYTGNDVVFPWSARPNVQEPFINLGDYDITLKPGHFYVVRVDAEGEDRRVMSETVRDHSGFDFEVVE